MSRNKTQLAQRVLEHINIVPIGQSPSADDGQYVENTWEEVAAELAHEQLIEFDDDDIPLDAFQPVMIIVAARVAPRYGVGGIDANGAYIKLSERISVNSSSEVAEVEYF